MSKNCDISQQFSLYQCFFFIRAGTIQQSDCTIPKDSLPRDFNNYLFNSKINTLVNSNSASHWHISNCDYNRILRIFVNQNGSGVDSASNRNDYQDYFLGVESSRCVELTNVPSSCADCLEKWEPQSPGTLRASPGL